MKVKLIHKCKNLRELTKIERKYVFPSLKCKFKNGKHIPGSRVSKYDLYDWYIYYQVFKEELQSEEFIKYASKSRNLELIRKEALEAISQNLHKGPLYLVGIEITQEDYYWLYYDGENYYRSTCVGSIEEGFDWYDRT